MAALAPHSRAITVVIQDLDQQDAKTNVEEALKSQNCKHLQKENSANL
jgi:hypothetical protein